MEDALHERRGVAAGWLEEGDELGEQSLVGSPAGQHTYMHRHTHRHTHPHRHRHTHARGRDNPMVSACGLCRRHSVTHRTAVRTSSPQAARPSNRCGAAPRDASSPVAHSAGESCTTISRWTELRSVVFSSANRACRPIQRCLPRRRRAEMAAFTAAGRALASSS